MHWPSRRFNFTSLATRKIHSAVDLYDLVTRARHQAVMWSTTHKNVDADAPVRTLFQTLHLWVTLMGGADDARFPRNSQMLQKEDDVEEHMNELGKGGASERHWERRSAKLQAKVFSEIATAR